MDAVLIARHRLVSDSVDYIDLREDVPRTLIIAAAEAIVAEMADTEVEATFAAHVAAMTSVATQYADIWDESVTNLATLVPTPLVEHIRWRLGATDQLWLASLDEPFVWHGPWGAA